MKPRTRTCGRSTARRSGWRWCRSTCSIGPASAPPSTAATASPHRIADARHPRGDHRAGDHRDAERHGDGRRRPGQASGAVLHHQHHVHEPQPRPRRAARRVVLERPPLLQTNQELVLLRQDDRGAGRVGGGAGTKGEPGGGDPGGDARRAAATQHKHQHQAHTQVPHRRGQGVRQQVARLRACQGRRRGARQGVRGAQRRRTALRLRQEDAAPRRALPDPRRALPGVTDSHKEQYRPALFKRMLQTSEQQDAIDNSSKLK